MILTSGFGHSMTWDYKKTDTASDQMSIRDAMILIAQHHVLYMLMPRWVYKLPFKKSVLLSRFLDCAHASGSLTYNPLTGSATLAKLLGLRWNFCVTSFKRGSRILPAVLPCKATFSA